MLLLCELKIYQDFGTTGSLHFQTKSLAFTKCSARWERTLGKVAKELRSDNFEVIFHIKNQHHRQTLPGIFGKVHLPQVLCNFSQKWEEHNCLKSTETTASSGIGYLDIGR